MSYSSEVLADSPVAYWRLGEGSGQPQDSAGTNHTTVTGGTPTYGVAGALTSDSNTAIDLDGATEYFSAPDAAALDLGDVATYEAWMKWSSTGTTGPLISKGTNTLILDITGAGQVRFRVLNTALVVHSSTLITDTTTWHHVVGTKNGATAKVYIDGADVTVVDGDATAADNAAVMEIGRDTGPNFFTGSLDEVAIYNTALSATRVAAHYAAATAGGPPTIALRTAGSWVAATATTQTVTLPTHQTGDMLIVRVGFKHATMPTTVTCGTAGWAKVATEVNGTGGASSNGGGGVEVCAFWKEAASGAETNPVITFNGGSVAATPSAAVANSYSKSAGTWDAPVGNGAAVAAATSISATIATHISTISGDLVDEFHVTNDNTTLTVPTFTQTGLTLAAVVESPAAALSSTTSNDIAADGCYRIATAGTSSAAAVITGTNSVADLGAAWTTRLRITAAAATDADAGVATGTGAAGGVSASLAPRGGLGSGTGAANNATVNAVVATNAAAGTAAGTGAAANATAKTAPVGGVATGTGAANGVSGRIAPVAGTAAGTGTANNASGGLGTTANAGTAAGTGAAGAASTGVLTPANNDTAEGDGEAYDAFASNIAVGFGNGTGAVETASVRISGGVAGTGTGTGAARQPSLTVVANAGEASPSFPTGEPAAGIGTASQTAASIKPVAAIATGTGTAQAAVQRVGGGAGLPPGTGAAQAPRPSVATSGGPAAGTGAAFNPTIRANATIAAAAGIGEAYQPNISGSPNINVNADTATGTGAAGTVAAAIRLPAGSAAGTGAGAGLASNLGSAPASATGTGAALAPAAKVQTNAEAAEGTGDVPASSTAGFANAAADAASGIGSALAGTVIVAVNPAVADAVGVAGTSVVGQVPSGGTPPTARASHSVPRGRALAMSTR